MKKEEDDETVIYCVDSSGQELDIVFDRNGDKFVFMPSKSELQSTSKILKVKQINVRSSYMICEMSEILDVLKNVHQFLVYWGV